MIIWTGMGGIIFLIAFIIFMLLGVGLPNTSALLSGALSGIVAGLVTIGLGVFFRRNADARAAAIAEKEAETGVKVNPWVLDAIGMNPARRPSIFFIPAHFFGGIIVCIFFWAGFVEGF
jgi:hypothetical protein